MSTVPTMSNPSDYEFILKSISEGNLISKAESLKRLNTLVTTDKKQFAIYAKRVVIAMQDLLCEPKEDLNLLAGTLVLEIINLNPREIQYYIRTKLLKNMVRNLGDPKPQIRKTSHYCLLAYIKTYKTFDELIQAYLHYGIQSDSWQLKQKSINSFQSILIMEMKYLNWSSSDFKKMIQELLNRLKDQNQFVQKAAEQCLVSICKCEEIRAFSKKLGQGLYNSLKDFCEAMVDQGILNEMKLYVPEIPTSLPKNFSTASVYMTELKMERSSIPLNTQKLLKNQNVHSILPKSITVSSISKIQEMRKRIQTPIVDKQFAEDKNDKNQQRQLKKVESVSVVSKRNQRQSILPSLRKSIQIQQKQPETEIRSVTKIQKNDGSFGRKLTDDLRNQKDWKIRLQAIQQLQAKFTLNKGSTELESIAKTFLPILIKLLADPNFKVALIALKIIQDILCLQNINQTPIIPQLVDKITDGKIALRQNISKLIRNQFNRTNNKIWLIELLNQLKKNPVPNSNIKQQIINVISKITIQAEQSQNRMQTLCANLQQIVETICPLMDDLKTKIKIKTLDLLILLSVKTGNIQLVKMILASRLNQVYFQMYLEKIAKEVKNLPTTQNQIERGVTADKKNRSERGPLTNRRPKISNNTTSSHIRKYSSVEPVVDEHNSTVKTALFLNRNQEYDKKQQDVTSLKQIYSKQTEPSSPSKNSIIKSYRKKNFDYKSTQYSAFSLSNTGSELPPFHDPERQLKNIMTEIKSEEWQTCSQSLTKLRRIVQNHCDLLTPVHVKTLMPQVMRLVQSLRSNLSKNAVIALFDMSNKLKKMLDSELDLMFGKLLKKTLDANSFISEQVKKALESICSNCNETRVVTLLINSHTSRAVPIKLSIVNVIESIVFLPKMYEKQLERITGMLVNFMGQGSLEVRDKAKTILASILNSEKGEKIVKLIPNEHLAKLAYRPSKQIQKAESKVQVENPQRKQEMLQSKLNKRKKQKITVFPEQFDKLQNLLQQCQSSDWKSRQKNMSIINETIIEQFPKQFCQHKLGGRVIDVLSKQIGDPNVKVASNALKILQQIAKKIPEIIQHNLSVLTNQIFSCFASHKPEIKNLSQGLFDQIAENIQKWMLIQHMCNGALYGLQKSRPAIIMRLVEILPHVYNKGNKKTLLTKNLYPLINKLAEQNKPENLQGLVALMKTCDMHTQGEFMTYLKPKATQIFNSVKED